MVSRTAPSLKVKCSKQGLKWAFQSQAVCHRCSCGRLVKRVFKLGCASLIPQIVFMFRVSCIETSQHHDPTGPEHDAKPWS